MILRSCIYRHSSSATIHFMQYSINHYFFAHPEEVNECDSQIIHTQTHTHTHIHTSLKEATTHATTARGGGGGGGGGGKKEGRRQKAIYLQKQQKQRKQPGHSRGNFVLLALQVPQPAMSTVCAFFYFFIFCWRR
jgi:hypothetical protein